MDISLQEMNEWSHQDVDMNYAFENEKWSEENASTFEENIIHTSAVAGSWFIADISLQF